jgi:hypothetical protein
MLDKDFIVRGYSSEEVERIINRADPDEINQLLRTCELAEKPNPYAGAFAIAIDATDLGMDILERSREHEAKVEK